MGVGHFGSVNIIELCISQNGVVCVIILIITS